MPSPIHGLFCAVLLVAASAALAFAQETPEMDQVYQAALKSFQDGFLDRAGREFAEFADKFPNSAKSAEAILLQAQCLFALKDFKSVVALLTARLGRAGELTDQYRFWLAEAEFYNQRYEAAAKAYETLLAASTNASIRLPASYGEAWAYFKLGDFDRTIKLLSDPARAFQQATLQSTNEALVVRGYLLLGESYSKNKNFRRAQQVLTDLASRRLTPELDWDRLHLLALNALADQRPDDALSAATNLVALASNTNRLNKPVLHANSLMLLADIQRDKNPDAALAAYEQLTALERIPASQKQQALLRIIDLLVGQNRFTNAVARLEILLTQTNLDTPPDLVRLTMGELHLKQFYAAAGSPADERSRTNLALTNLLSQARKQFVLITETTNRLRAAKAYLNRGWCSWEEALLLSATNKFAESQADFRAAAEMLPESEDQAIARFKLADCQFQLKDYTNAVTNYRLVIDRYRDLPEVRTKWFDQAYYQMIRARLEHGDFARARDDLNQLLEAFPTSEFSARSVLNFAAELLERGRPAEAREARDALLHFQKKVTRSPWLPEAQLAIARSYVIENQWTAAIGEYDHWLAQYPTHASRPQATFDKALTYFRAGSDTNALVLFTNFVAQFPTNHLARWAQFWLGDYYYNQQNYTNAESHYQLLWNNTTNAPHLRYQAGLRAARAALLRDKPSDASQYLTNLLSTLDRDTNRPAAVEVEAYLLLADVALKDVSATTLTNSLRRFENALVPLGRIISFYPTNPLAPVARAKMADCYLQLAGLDPAQAAVYYSMAMTNYFGAMEKTSPAEVAMRSQAEVGFAIALEKFAHLRPLAEQKPLLNRALDHFLNVAYGKVVVTAGGKPDPFWMAKARQEAGRLAESMDLTGATANVLQRLFRDFPQWQKLQPNLVRKLQELKNAESK
ncbi:MAG: tetratricopeptide repeat protein [Verrucomicrobia bacterium]|nr:tetratricopeptide repeat protein [Verrucomicrobiota bacterium]